MSRHQLAASFGEHQIAHLGAGVDAVDWLESVRVPESNASVGCSAASCQESGLVRVPGDGLDGCFMLAKLCDR